MTQSEFLDADELQRLTGYARANAQARWLRAENIPHQARCGRVLVSRHHARQWLEGRLGPAVSFHEPDLSCVR